MAYSDSGLRFEVLGHVRAWQNGTELSLGAPKQRAVLAMLLVQANVVLSVEQIIDAVWGTTPPKTADPVYTYIKGLRRALNDPKGQILTSPAGASGYRLDISRDAIDLARFDDYVSAARNLSVNGDPAASLAIFEQAFALWRGQPFGDLGAALDDTQREPIIQRYLAAVEDAAVSALSAGGPYAEIISRLSVVTTEYPIREQAWACLMTMLARAGRRAEALAAFDVVCKYLEAELDTGPGPELTKLHSQILKQRDPHTAPPGGPQRVDVLHATSTPALPERAAVRAVPAQLPQRVAGFAARERELQELDNVVIGQDNEKAGSPVKQNAPIILITGTAGVGKTTLAVYWAHQVSHRFPDGCLYADLNGYGLGQPATPVAVLTSFMRALGVEKHEVPRDLAELAGSFRSLVAARKVLILLDNARNAADVRHLLPGQGQCLTLVTSRDRLAGIAAQYGATTIRLGLLPSSDAIALLRNRIPSRVVNEPHAAAELADSCAGLPLTLAVAAELARRRQDTGLHDLVAEMSNQEHRLDLLSAQGDPHTAARTVFSWSYRNLGEVAARTFRYGALHAGRAISTAAVGALTGMTGRQSAEAIQALVDASLWEEVGIGRFHSHDLLQDYAGELNESLDPGPESADALHRVLLWYLHTAAAAETHLTAARRRLDLEPHHELVRPLNFNDSAEAMTWLETERANLVEACRQAYDEGFMSIAWQLPATLGVFFYIGKYWADWRATHETGLGAAERIGNPIGIARIATSLGNAYYDQENFSEAIVYHGKALAIRQEAGDLAGQAISLMNLAEAYCGMCGLSQHQPGTGSLEQTSSLFTQALTIFEEVGDRYGQAMTLSNLGDHEFRHGHFAPAASYAERSLPIRRELGDPHGLSFTLNLLGDIKCQLGQYSEAIESLSEARSIRHTIGDRHNEAVTLSSLAEVMAATGNTHDARTLWENAIALLASIDDARADATRQRMRDALDDNGGS